MVTSSKNLSGSVTAPKTGVPAVTGGSTGKQSSAAALVRRRGERVLTVRFFRFGFGARLDERDRSEGWREEGKEEKRGRERMSTSLSEERNY